MLVFSNNKPSIEASISGELGGELIVEELVASLKVDGREDVIDEVGGGGHMSGTLNLIRAVSSRLSMLPLVIIVSGFLKGFLARPARGVGEPSGSKNGLTNFWGASSLVEVDFSDGVCSGDLKPFSVSLLVLFCVFLERFEAR